MDLGFYTRMSDGLDPLNAMVTVDLLNTFEQGAGVWLHMSVSRKTRLPTWDDLVLAREELGFKDLLFIQLLPPTRAWLNVHSYCLHLLHRLDAEVVPRMLWDQEGADGENYRKPGSMTPNAK